MCKERIITGWIVKAKESTIDQGNYLGKDHFYTPDVLLAERFSTKKEALECIEKEKGEDEEVKKLTIVVKEE